jgi:hypothetical protein
MPAPTAQPETAATLAIMPVHILKARDSMAGSSSKELPAHFSSFQKAI